MSKRKVLVVAGTRPEIIKLAPVIKALETNNQYFETQVCLTGQHKDLVYPLLDLFQISPNYDLEVMREGQSLAQLSAKLLTSIEIVLKKYQPDLVIVQGDTTTAYIGALAAFYRKISIAHVEAGLRTYNQYSPFPEEMNRAMIGRMATYHFAPTENAIQNLIAEGVPMDAIHKSGNTTIDSLFWMIKNLDTNKPHIHLLQQKIKAVEAAKLVLVTIHRRENQGKKLKQICSSLKQLAQKHPIKIVFPVHPNPNVKDLVFDYLNTEENIILLPSQPYDSFVWLMSKADLIITDSGGIQEEAPSLGKAVIVLRNSTERKEGLLSRCCTLVNLEETSLEDKVVQLLYHSEDLPKAHLYGDGKAAERIVASLKDHSRSMVKELLTTI